MLTKNNESNNFFYASLILILITEIIINFLPNISGLFKLAINSYIYISFLIVILTFSFNQFENLKFYLKTLIFFLICITFYQFLRADSVDALYFADNLLLAKFGNKSYGPMFLIPIFIFWGLHYKAIFFLEKISLLSIKLGILFLPFCYYFNLKYPITVFLPSFFLLASYKYSDDARKFWIILGIILSFLIFYLNDYRAGIIRLSLGLIIFFIIINKLKIFKKVFLILSFLIPIMVVQDSIYSDVTFFEKVAAIFSDTQFQQLSMDTRSLLYKETINDLILNQDILFGKGPLGSYYSPYFDQIASTDIYSERDHYIRSTVEVGLLHYLLKGGAIYFIIITLIFLFVCCSSSKNDYINYLILTASSYYFLLTIENIPFYDFLNALIWVIIGIIISSHNRNLSNDDIKKILTKNI